jgi:hypothetical protein
VASNAYSDYNVRKSKVDVMQSMAISSLDPALSSLYAECAAVLACAALERYMNDVLEEYCTSFNETSWDDLSPGRQRYLLRHVALKMERKSGSFSTAQQLTQSDCTDLIRFVNECSQALANPSTWHYFSDFGMFGEGSSSPKKIICILRAFDSDGRSIAHYLEESGHDRNSIMQSLTQLVNTRHATAHAIKGSSPPSSSDTETWINASATLVQTIDSFLGFAPDLLPIEQPISADGAAE